MVKRREVEEGHQCHFVKTVAVDYEQCRCGALKKDGKVVWKPKPKEIYADSKIRV